MPRKRRSTGAEGQAPPPYPKIIDDETAERLRAFREQNPPLRDQLKRDEFRHPGQAKLLDEIRRTHRDRENFPVKFSELIESWRQKPVPGKQQRKRSKHTKHRGWQRDRVTAAIRELYGDIPPETKVPNSELCAAVTGYFMQAKRLNVPGSQLPIPSPKVILRATGRIR